MKIINLLIIAIIIYGCNTTSVKEREINLIPSPKEMKTEKGYFIIDNLNQIKSKTKEAERISELFKKLLKDKYSVKEDGKVGKEISFEIEKNGKILPEGYTLLINKENIEVKASTEAGLFYAFQTLKQLLYGAEKNKPALPYLTINDYPKFEWRGMHLDVSRHFMPTSFIKKYIDYLAMYKLNTFHWHLVDGTGWRIEIKSHKELTDIAAWRVVKKNSKPWEKIEAWKEGDNRPKYGGFYTQEEIKEIVQYAKDKCITIIPEIELPGHSEIVFDCFPDLICKDKKGEALKNIGVYCAANPAAYKLLEDVIDEIIKLFPSEYIHIGGDEVNKSNWKKCTDCQKMMKKHNYDVQELQSHFINHFDKYIKSKGRKLMGWHEILEGELSETANIMYWGGIDGFEEILKKGHKTVQTTGTSLYFDHYQNLSIHEPEAFGGFTPIKQVYALELIPKNISDSLKNLVLGAQANVWTEYMPNPKHVEYMIFPRIIAFAENVWGKNTSGNWTEFRQKVDKELDKLNEMNINYAKSAYRPNIEIEVDSLTKKPKITLNTELPCQILYTLDGSKPSLENPNKYTKPFIIDTTKTISALAVKNNKIITEEEKEEIIVHKAGGRKIHFINKPYKKYSAKGAKSLIDMEFGGITWGSGKWIGMLNKDLEVIIEFEKETEIEKITLSCIEDNGSAIFFPENMEVLNSKDGKKFVSLKKEDLKTEEPKRNRLKKFQLKFDKTQCKYLKVKAKCQKRDDMGVFIFADEIIVE